MQHSHSGVQAECRAAAFPTDQDLLRQGRNVTALALTSDVAGDAGGGATTPLATATDAAAPCAGPTAAAGTAARFSDLSLGPFSRVYLSQTADAVLTALCVLAATAAGSAVLARAVKASCGRRGPASFHREDAYSIAFLPKRSGLPLATALLVFAAAVAWVVLETAFIFLALPRPVDVPFDRALEHVVVDSLTNYGPETADGCRAVTWRVPDVDLVQQVILRRCAFTGVIQPAAPGAAVQDADAPTAQLTVFTAEDTLLQVRFL